MYIPRNTPNHAKPLPDLSVVLCTVTDLNRTCSKIFCVQIKLKRSVSRGTSKYNIIYDIVASKLNGSSSFRYTIRTDWVFIRFIELCVYLRFFCKLSEFNLIQVENICILYSYTYTVNSYVSYVLKKKKYCYSKNNITVIKLTPEGVCCICNDIWNPNAPLVISVLEFVFLLVISSHGLCILNMRLACSKASQKKNRKLKQCCQLFLSSVLKTKRSSVQDDMAMRASMT